MAGGTGARPRGGRLAQGAATAGGQPDLRITQLSNPAPSIVQGETFRASETTANLGTAASPETRTYFYLSTNKTKSASDMQLEPGRNVGALEPGAKHKRVRDMTVPANTPADDYYLLACAD